MKHSARAAFAVVGAVSLALAGLGAASASGPATTRSATARAPWHDSVHSRWRDSVDSRWRDSVPFRVRVVSAPSKGGGYPTPTGKYVPGTCRVGTYDSNFPESTIAQDPVTGHLVGASKFFFSRYSTYYNFTTGTFDISARSSRPHIIGGYDCASTGTQKTPPTWTNTTDPNIAFDTTGRAYDTVLAFNSYRLDGDIYSSYSDDDGHHWRKGNGGKPLQIGPVDAKNGAYLDKPWVAVTTHPGSPDLNHVYAIWAVRTKTSSSISFAVSRNRGKTFARTISIPTPQKLSATNPWPYITVGAGGDLYVMYIAYGAGGTARFWTGRSSDDGRTWGHFRPAGPLTHVDLADHFPGTIVHVGAPESFTASPDKPGHLYLAWEEIKAGRLGIRFTSSTDGGRTWSPARQVNDDHGPSDQVQPVIAAGSRGAVAIAFYDRRLACPNSAWVLPADRGRANTCFSVSLQALRDTGSRVAFLGGNRRISARAWDPNQPAQKRDGLGQLPCDAFDDPCTDIFIGDFFGLTITDSAVDALSVSTAYPSRVRSDSGGPIYYQQQVLSTVQRASLGL